MEIEGEDMVGNRKRIPPDKIEEAKTMLAMGKSQRQTAKEVGISLTKVNEIANSDPDEMEQLRTQKKVEFIDRAWGVIGKYLERLEDESLISKTPAHGCTTVIGTLIDKTRLISGEATEHVKHSYIAEWGGDDED